MSDAEYYMEQQEEEARFQQASTSDKDTKLLLCWTDKRPGEEVWDWQPLSKVPGIFAELHKQQHIGTEYFLARRLPTIEEDGDTEVTSLGSMYSADEVKTIQTWDFVLAKSDDMNIYEVLVVSRQDSDRLQSEAIKQQAASTTLKQTMVAEMLEEMAVFINADRQSTVFVFARRV
jgi:hypothetical protein